MLAPEALHGLPGRIVETIAPYTESDPVAILLTLSGRSPAIWIGPGPHACVEKDLPSGPAQRRPSVGRTSKARKGTLEQYARLDAPQADPPDAATRIRTGLSSGEGLIYNVRDAREEMQPVKKRGRVVAYQRVRVDEGESDKRLLVDRAGARLRVEADAGVRRIASPPTLRLAWDSGDLSTLTKKQPTAGDWGALSA